MVDPTERRKRPDEYRSGLSDSPRADSPITRQQVRLECGHIIMRNEPPTVGQQAYCVTHNFLTVVVSIHQQWHFKCTECHYGRTYGGNKIAAHAYAVKHAVKRHHRVKVMLDNEVVDIVGRDPDQLTTDDLELPPFDPLAR